MLTHDSHWGFDLGLSGWGSGVERGQPPPPADPGMIPLTVPETGRLLARPPPPGTAAHWLAWRRRHQARSRWYHQRARLARDAAIVLVR